MDKYLIFVHIHMACIILITIKMIHIKIPYLPVLLCFYSKARSVYVPITFTILIHVWSGSLSDFCLGKCRESRMQCGTLVFSFASLLANWTMIGERDWEFLPERKLNILLVNRVAHSIVHGHLQRAVSVYQCRNISFYGNEPDHYWSLPCLFSTKTKEAT